MVDGVTRSILFGWVLLRALLLYYCATETRSLAASSKVKEPAPSALLRFPGHTRRVLTSLNNRIEKMLEWGFNNIELL